MNITKLVAVVGATILLVSSCGSNTSTSVSTSTASKETTPVSAVIQVNPISQEKKLVATDKVPQNNCNGSALLKQTLEKIREVQYQISVESGLTVSADGSIGIPEIGKVGVGAQVATKAGVQYGRADQLKRAIEYSAKEGTSVLHTINSLEIWETGEFIVTAGGKTAKYPYKFLKDFGLEYGGAQQEACPTSLPITAQPENPKIVTAIVTSPPQIITVPPQIITVPMTVSVLITPKPGQTVTASSITEISGMGPSVLSAKDGDFSMSVIKAEFTGDKKTFGLLISLQFVNQTGAEARMKICGDTAEGACQLTIDTGRQIDSFYNDFNQQGSSTNDLDVRFFSINFNSSWSKIYFSRARIPTGVRSLIQLYVPGLSATNTKYLQVLEVRLFDLDQFKWFNLRFENIPIPYSR